MTTQEKLNETIAFLKEFVSCMPTNVLGDNSNTFLEWLNDLEAEPYDDPH